MSFLDLPRTTYRHLKRHPRIGVTVRRVDQSMRDWHLRLNLPLRARLMKEWQSCTAASGFLEFADKHFACSQKHSEILGFAAFGRTTSPDVFCEIGTLHGGTHFFLTHALPSVSLTIAVDLVVENKAKLRMLEKRNQRSNFIDASSALPTTVDKVAAILEGRTIDLLFIDGDHSYEGARSDFLIYRRFVREGGLIAFHDICADYQTRFGQSTPNYAGGVPLLWRTLSARYEHREFVDSPDQDAYGIGVLVHSTAIALPEDL